MSEIAVNKYLDVFPDAGVEHARSVMERQAPPERSWKSVYLLLESLPSVLLLGSPAHRWLSLAADSETFLSARITVSPCRGVVPHDDPLLSWSCVFQVSSDDPDLLREQVDALLTKYLDAGYEMTPSLTYRAPRLTATQSVFRLALSDEHNEMVKWHTGRTPLLMKKPSERFTVGNLDVLVDNPEAEDLRPRMGLRSLADALLRGK